jgi:hypothetical protein
MSLQDFAMVAVKAAGLRLAGAWYPPDWDD